MEATKLLSKLESLVGQAGKNLYERVRTIEELCKDRDWLEAEWNGNEGNMLDAMEVKYFHDVCGAVSIYELREVYATFPEEAQWQAQRWHITKLLAKARANKPKEEAKHGERRSVKIKDHEDLQAQVRDVQYALKREQSNAQKIHEEKVELEREVQRLRCENARLEGRVAELERMVERFAQRVPA